MNMPKLFGKIRFSMTKNAPSILTGIGAIGVIATAYFSGKAAVKAEKLKTKIKWEDSSKKEDKKLVTEIICCYAPAVIIGGVTIASVLCSNHIYARRFKAVCKAYNQTADRYSVYKMAVASIAGKDVAEKIDKKVSEFETWSDEKKPSDDKILFIDVFSNQRFWSTELDVLNAQYHYNRNFQIREWATINELYDFYGIDHVEDVDIRGFDLYELESNWGYRTIDFENIRHEEDNGTVWYEIYMAIDPWILWEEETTEDSFTYLEEEETLRKEYERLCEEE